MTDGDVILTAGDIEDLNRDAVLRAAAFVRIAGAVLVGVGAVGAAAWLWSAVRTQQQATPSTGFSFDSRLAVGLGHRPHRLLAPFRGGARRRQPRRRVRGRTLRLVTDFIASRSGGSITGFEPGDSLGDVTP